MWLLGCMYYLYDFFVYMQFALHVPIDILNLIMFSFFILK